MEYIAASKSDRTREAYKGDWKHWQAWCLKHAQEPLPATESALVNYIASLAAAGYKASTISRRLSSIAAAHRIAGSREMPTAAQSVRDSLSGIARTHGSAQKQARPLLWLDVQAIADTLDTGTLQDTRDRALILFGFAAALRRSEISAMQVEHLSFSQSGVMLSIPKSKTDPLAQGQSVAVPFARQNPGYCPVSAVKAWLGMIGEPKSGFVWRAIQFTTDGIRRRINERLQVAVERAVLAHRVDEIVKSAVARANLPLDGYSAHSLRAGLASQAAKSGVAERVIMATTRHKSERQVRAYIREVQQFEENAAAAFL